MSKWIDADALKDKLQQHHDFYVMAWGGFSKMPIGEKKRVDEITNCIAEVVNAPTIDAVEVVRGEWKVKSSHEVYCDNCGFTFDIMKCDFLENMKFCPNCGAKMSKESE